MALGGEVRDAMVGYYKVDNVTDEHQLDATEVRPQHLLARVRAA